MRTLNKKAILMCIIIYLLFSASAYAQEFLFKVIAVSGNVACLKGTSAKWENIKTGNKIFPEDKLKLELGDYLGLINHDGRSIELTQPGLYNASDLNRNIQKGSSSFKKFTDFVINESVANKKKSENMKTLGAVVRSRAGIIDCFFPEYTDLLGTSLETAWYSAGTGISYVFIITDQDNHTVFRKETKDTSITLDLKQFGLTKNVSYIWCVTCEGQEELKSDPCTFRLLGDINLQAIIDTVDIIIQDLDFNSAVDQFILVKFLESKNINYDALKGFDNIVRSYPGVEDYLNNYIVFLLKHNITRKAELLLQLNRK